VQEGLPQELKSAGANDKRSAAVATWLMPFTTLSRVSLGLNYIQSAPFALIPQPSNADRL
jgi:hypothetical protein